LLTFVFLYHLFVNFYYFIFGGEGSIANLPKVLYVTYGDVYLQFFELEHIKGT